MHIHTNICTYLQIHTHAHTISLRHVWEGISRLLLENTRVCLQIPPPSSPPSSSFSSLLSSLPPFCRFLSFCCCVDVHTHTMYGEYVDIRQLPGLVLFHLYMILGVGLPPALPLPFFPLFFPSQHPAPIPLVDIGIYWP